MLAPQKTMNRNSTASCSEMLSHLQFTLLAVALLGFRYWDLVFVY